MSFLRVSLLSTAMFVPACLAADEPTPLPLDEPSAVGFRCPGCTWGPPLTNTHGLNGLSVAALDTTGVMHDGWRLVSVEILLDRTYIPVYNVYTEDGSLFGVDANANAYAGKGFVGSRWTVELEETSQTVVLEAESFDDDGLAPRYTFTGSTGTSGNEKGYTCAQDPETGEYSVVLFRDLDVDAETGTHSERADTIYFACVSGAVGKAALWGYAPWATDDDTYQAATRAVRADYCGDGTPHTLQGTALQVTDILHIREFPDAEKTTEAMWGPDGAMCLEATRLGEDPETIVCNGERLPTCRENDGFGHWPSALIWTKIWS